MKILHRTTDFFAITVSILITLLCFFRMYLGQKDFLKNNIWAEDGLFIICNLKYSFITCITDSYSGYLLFYPRLISYIVHYFDMNKWALINNLLYFTVIFILSYFIFLILNKEYSKKISALATVSPFLLAIISDQVLNVHSSLYLIVTYYLILIFSNNAWQKIDDLKIKFGLILIVFLHATSTPFGLIILFLILIKVFLKRKEFRIPKWLVIFTFIANLLQLWTILNANENRQVIEDNLLILKNSFNYFLKTVISIFYYPRGMKLDSNIFLQQNLVTFLYANIYILIFVIILFTLFPFFKQGPNGFKWHSIAITSIAEFIILFISSKTYGWPYRFLILSSSLIFWIIINLLSLIKVRLIKIVGFSLLLVTVLNNLVVNFSITPYRTEGPKWLDEIHGKSIICEDNLNLNEEVYLTFYPNWPTENPHAYGLSEPTTNAIECSRLIELLKN